MTKLYPAVIACLAFSACKQSIPPTVAATVNGRPITYTELDRQYQRQFTNGGGDRPNDDQVLIQKLQVLSSMVDNEIMLQRAEKLSLMAVESDVDAKFNELKAPYTQEEFQRQLKARTMTADDLKAQLRRDLSVQKLLNKEITSHIAVTDQDVADFYHANKNNFNLAEPQIHMLQIVVSPRPNPDVRNLKNDKAQNEEQASSKAQMLLQRIRQGEDFSMLAQNYSEDPDSAANGGDIGFVQESALDKVSPELKKLVMSLQPGQVSPVIHTQEGYRILKVLTKEPAGQRELQDPRVQQSIRDMLINRKDQLLRAAYYEVARNEAKVVNQLALGITQNKDKK